MQKSLCRCTRGTTRYGIGGLKAALDVLGYAGGEVRAPLPQPRVEAREEIARLLEECGAFDETQAEGPLGRGIARTQG